MRGEGGIRGGYHFCFMFGESCLLVLELFLALEECGEGGVWGIMFVGA